MSFATAVETNVAPLKKRRTLSSRPRKEVVKKEEPKQEEEPLVQPLFVSDIPTHCTLELLLDSMDVVQNLQHQVDTHVWHLISELVHTKLIPADSSVWASMEKGVAFGCETLKNKLQHPWKDIFEAKIDMLDALDGMHHSSCRVVKQMFERLEPGYDVKMLQAMILKYPTRKPSALLPHLLVLKKKKKPEE